jgi:hypothetical protein
MNYFKNPSDGQVYGYDPATQQDLIDQAIANGWEDVTGSWPPLPQPPTADDNKEYAKARLAETDWSEIPSVNDASFSPHLDNGAAFVTYRTIIRSIVVNPVAGDIVWPVQPKAQWSN